MQIKTIAAALIAALIQLSMPTIILADQVKIIAITQIVNHPSLNEAKKGVKDALSEGGYVEGKNLQIIDEIAQGNISIAAQVADKLVSMKPDIIMPISTVSAQTVLAKAKGSNIPVIFSSVTDASAAGLGNNNVITGAVDFPPMKEGVLMIKQLIPNIKKLGIIYNPGESNSVKSVQLIKMILKDMNIEIIESTATSSNNVSDATNHLMGKVDAIYLPSDNTVWSSMKVLIKIANSHKIPVFSSDPDSVRQGVLAALGYSQYDVGYRAGQMAVSILNGASKLKDIKVSTPAKYRIYLNEESSKKLGIKIPNMILNNKITIIE